MARLKVKYHDFEMEVEGSEEFVDGKSKDFPSILDKLFTAESKLVIESAPQISNQIQEKATNDNIEAYQSMGAFLKEKNFSNDTDLVLGITYYICHNEGKDVLTTQDIKDALKKIKHSTNMNIADKINGNIRKGFIEECGNSSEGLKCFTILKDGEDFIKNFKRKEEKPKNKKKSSTAQKLNQWEKDTIDQVIKLDNYNKDDINWLKQITMQKNIVLGSIYLIDKVNPDTSFNSSILYEFIRFLGLNVEKSTISARMSEVRSFFDKTESGLKLSNYGREEIAKILEKVES